MQSRILDISSGQTEIVGRGADFLLSIFRLMALLIIALVTA